MAQQTFDAHYGARVALDICHTCAALWFDGSESVVLAPGAVLELFAAIHEHRVRERTPLGRVLPCPRCRGRLERTADMQRSTRFNYWRCPGNEGRFITFFDFLREKNFVRPLSPREMAELKRNVKTLACASCGAPVDLARESECRYCRAPIAMLDSSQMEKVVEALKLAEAKRQAPAPADLPFRLHVEKANVDRLFDRLARDAGGLHDSFALVETGLAALFTDDAQ
jgi:hypothetical protein